MQQDLLAIKNKIVDKIITITVAFIAPTFVAFVYRLITEGWGHLFLFTLVYNALLLLLYVFRKRIPFEVKLHLHSFIFMILGIVVLYSYSFSGVFYLSFIPIVLNGILLGRKPAALYLVAISFGYFLVAYSYISGSTGDELDYNYQLTDTFTWVAFFLGTLFVLVIILFATTELYRYFVDVIQSKNKLTLKLKEHQDQLELLVKERTEELETTNEELVSTNEELYKKNQLINSRNNKLKETLRHLKETQAKLLQADKMASLGILTAGVAHEINNPLNFIMGAYEGLKIHNDDTNCKHREQVSDLLHVLKTGIDRTSAIVKSLNQFSRASKTTDEECHIHNILDNCLTMLNHEMKGRIAIKKQYHPANPITKGNVGNLHQVFINLLTNAVQSINGNGKITLKTGIEDHQLFIEISDTGSGITKEKLPNITDPFFTTKKPGEGTGLGLYITYNILMEHNGTLDFFSEPDKGTTARVSLPLY